MPQLSPIDSDVTEVKMWLLKGSNIRLGGSALLSGLNFNSVTDIVLNRHCPPCKISACVLLQELSKVFAELLTARPLAHTVTVQRVGPSAFFM